MSALLNLAIGLAVIGAPVAAVSPTTRYVDDDGRAGPTCSSATATFRRIQRAVDASGPGDTVKVCPGTYREHVLIGPARDGLRLVAATATRPTLRPHRTPPTYLYNDPDGEDVIGARGVIHVNGAGGIVVRGFRFLPHGGTGTCAEVAFVTVIRDSTVRIVDNVFSGIAPFDTGCMRYAQAVDVSRDNDGEGDVPSLVVVQGNTIRDFGGGVSSFLAFIRVRENRFLVRDDGDADHRQVVSAYGIGLDVRDNVVRVDPASSATVGFFHAELDPGPSAVTIVGNVVEGVTTGIDVLFGRGQAVRIRDNVLLGRGSGPAGSSGIVLRTTSSPRVEDNVVTGFRGSGIKARSDGGVIEDNDFRGNIGIDCRSSSANITWRRNLGTESKPAGLCSRYR